MNSKRFQSTGLLAGIGQEMQWGVSTGLIAVVSKTVIDQRERNEEWSFEGGKGLGSCPLVDYK